MMATILISLASLSAFPARDDDSLKPEAIHATEEKALPLFLKRTAEAPEKRDCLSFHHQADPVLAFATA
jgi:hypothetical protein